MRRMWQEKLLSLPAMALMLIVPLSFSGCDNNPEYDENAATDQGRTGTGMEGQGTTQYGTGRNEQLARAEVDTMMNDTTAVDTVEIIQGRFQPERLTVRTGDRVVWVNRTDSSCTVTTMAAAGMPGAAQRQPGRMSRPDTGMSRPDTGRDTSGMREVEARLEGEVEPGDTLSFTFEEPGVYQYQSEQNPQMRGTIVVTEGGAYDERQREEHETEPVH